MIEDILYENLENKYILNHCLVFKKLTLLYFNAYKRNIIEVFFAPKNNLK